MPPFPTSLLSFFFFNDTATPEIYPLSLHDALPILIAPGGIVDAGLVEASPPEGLSRSEEHTSELQSRRDLVCRLLLEKKKHSACRPVSLPQKRLGRHGVCARPAATHLAETAKIPSCSSSSDWVDHHLFFLSHSSTPEIYTLSLHDALPI